MPFDARGVRVLIASPGDTVNERRVIRRALEDWNALNADQGVLVLPMMWERDATPEMGERAQGLINRQLVDAADMLIGVFWTRLGTPTSEADSGTVEEIERCIAADKPVLLYFSSKPVHLDSVDSDEYARLKSARGNFQARGLIDRFESEEELGRKVTAAVTKTIRSRFAQSLVAADLSEPEAPATRATVIARIDRQREVRGISTSGTPQYTTRERLVITNIGSATVENLTFAIEVPEGTNAPAIGKDTAAIAYLPPGAAVDYPLMTTFGTASQWDIVFRWREGEAEREARQTMS